MNAAGIILVLLSNQGHWFGGQPGTISVRWVAEGSQPEAVLAWDVMMGATRMAGDRVGMATGSDATTIEITPPTVRVRTTMRWVYRLHRRAGGEELGRGEAVLHLYPDDLLTSLDKRLAGKRLMVWDKPEGLPAVLAKAKVACERIGDSSQLAFARADIVLVGRDRLGEVPFEQSPLMGLAQAGANVLVFEQHRPQRLAGYALAQRKAPVNLEWRREHLLLGGFEPEDLRSFFDSDGEDVWAVQLPTDEPALEVAYWPREAPGERAVPIDALLVVKAMGKGRVVLCQVPLGDWQRDPRAQQLLGNGLAFLVTRPEATPPPSQRRVSPPPASQPVPSIAIPRGDLR